VGARLTGLREALWLGCRPKTCCYTAVVIPTGHDVWQITRALDAPPWSFLMYFGVDPTWRDAFALDRSGRRFRLALAKNPELRQGDLDGCTFLFRTRTGEHRCGLGDLRPTGCRIFPLTLCDGLVGVQADHGCTCRAWSLADADTATERPLLEARVAEAETYCEIVARWNSMLEAGPPDVHRTFVEYCEYLLDVYDQLAEALPATSGAVGA